MSRTLHALETMVGTHHHYLFPGMATRTKESVSHA